MKYLVEIDKNERSEETVEDQQKNELRSRQLDSDVDGKGI